MINQTATNNLNFLIDPTFKNVNRLFVLAFPNEEDRRSFSKFYTPTVEVKYYNIIIDREQESGILLMITIMDIIVKVMMCDLFLSLAQKL